MFSKFGEYGIQHGLVVMDMQPRYVDRTNVDPECVRKLVVNVSKEVEICLSAGGPVYFVEYQEDGETIGAICGYDRRKLPGVTVLEKNHNDLMQSSEDLRGKARLEMRMIKQKGISLTFAGVNISECVRRSANSVNDMEIPVNTPAGLVLDLGRYHDVANNIKLLRQMPWNDGILYIPEGMGDRGDLKDFL